MPRPTLPGSSDLPYFLPADPEGQLRELAKILNIPLPVAMSGGPKSVGAFSAVILFRHLSQHQEALRVMESLPSRELRGKLVAKALDTTFVNPKWVSGR